MFGFCSRSLKNTWLTQKCKKENGAKKKQSKHFGAWKKKEKCDPGPGVKVKREGRGRSSKVSVGCLGGVSTTV